jgi:capsular exopolysaccharide synthesis family protein
MVNNGLNHHNSEPGMELAEFTRARPGAGVLVPAIPQMPGSYRQAPGENPSESVSRFVRVLLAHKWKILSFMALSMVLAVVVSLFLQKLYEGTATIKLDAKNSAGIIGQQATTSLAGNDMDQIITTEIEIVQSDPVLRPVVEKYHLLEMEKQTRGLDPAEIERLHNAPIELKRLKVKRPPNTYLILISYRAPTPELAAAITNAIADSYIAHAFDSKNRSYAEVSGLIARQLKELRAKTEASSALLTSYEKELDMVDPEQRTSVLSTRLLQLNTEYTGAQADRMKKEADDKENRLPTVASAEVSVQGQALERAVERLDTARQHFATVSSVYGENNAEYKKSQKEVKELETQVEALKNNTRDRVHSDYLEALERENGVRLLLDQTKKEFERLSARTFQYQQLKQDADNDRKLYEDLDRHTREGDINNGFEDTIIQISSRALPPLEQVFPKLLLNLAIAFVLSGLVAAFVAMVSDAVDSTFSEPEDVAARLQVDLLCSVPAVKELPRASVLASAEEPGPAPNGKSQKRALALDRFGEAIRGLRNTISIGHIGRPVGSLLITSSFPGEGKSTTAAYLALTFALLGKRTLLIDADLRRGTAHSQFNLNGGHGLSDVLLGKAEWADAAVKIEPHPLYVMPSGFSRRASDLIGPGMSDLLNQIGREFDVILIDAPPLGFAESQQLASIVDGVMVVAKSGTTGGKVLAQTFAALFRARANVVGLVLNQVKGSRNADFGYYGYAYGYANRKGAIPTSKI